MFKMSYDNLHEYDSHASLNTRLLCRFNFNIICLLKVMKGMLTLYRCMSVTHYVLLQDYFLYLKYTILNRVRLVLLLFSILIRLFDCIRVNCLRIHIIQNAGECVK